MNKMFQGQHIFQNQGRLLWLIFASLLLLGLSQVLWINKVWEEQKDILQQETNYIFQRTALSLQDSLVRKRISENGVQARTSIVPPQLWHQKERQYRIPGEMHIFKPPVERNLMNGADIDGPAQTTQIKVIASTTDTQAGVIQRGVIRFLLNNQPDTLTSPKDFVFDIQADTISEAVLYAKYALALDSAALPNSFKLIQFNFTPKPPAMNTLATEPAITGFMRQHFFQAVFHDYKGYLFQKILPYCLFSWMLLSLTALAFWLVFNTLKQQQKISQQKNEFISNVTHELKTPLTTVGVALEALDDFEVLQNPEKTKEYLQISKLELDRLNLLVDKVLRVSMFEHQALQLRPEMLDLVATARQVILAMTLQAKSAGAQIHFSTQSQPCMVYCDQLHLNGVVYNLLDNALKYRRELPEIEVSIENTLREGVAFFRLKVRDNGIGIADEHQAQIFEKFFRVPTGNTHNVKGHGLGLSYVAHVVREHGGSIRVESVPGAGSSFIVEIPAATLPPGS